jgi:hypothetical protein
MSDSDERPRTTPGQRGAVARLAEAVAEAQAAARAGAAALGAEPAPTSNSGPAPAASDDGGATPESDDETHRLRDRIGSLPLVGDAAAAAPDPREPAPPEPVASPTAAGSEAATAAATVSAAPADRARDRPGRRYWPLYLLMTLLILAVPALVWTGYRIAADSTAGEVLSGRSNPSSPGYTALVEPTPTALVVQVSDSGHAQGLTVLSLSGPDQHGGAVIASPVDVRLTKPRMGVESFSGIIDLTSPATAGKVIGSELGLGFTEVIEVTDADLTTLLGPVAPLEIDNPEPVTEIDGTTLDAGPVELTAAEVPAYLTAQDVGHTISGKLARQQLVWTAWIDEIARDGGATAIPGETDVGLGRFLVGLAAGKVQATSFPVEAAPDADGRSAVKIDHDPAMLLIANLVPFPVAAVPGDRATVTLLNGTGPGAVPAAVIQRLVFAGAQITSMGNAKRFGHARTTLTYADARARPFAEAMADRLGVGRVVHSDAADNGIDVEIVVGKDLLADPPGPLTTEEVASDR